MKIYILTSVALFAEYGDLDSLDTPSVNTQVFLSQAKAHAKMEVELETEAEEAKAQGYEDFSTEISENGALYQQGKPGSGCSWNQVTWEITEKEIPGYLVEDAREIITELEGIVKTYGKDNGDGNPTLLVGALGIYVDGWFRDDVSHLEKLSIEKEELLIEIEYGSCSAYNIPTNDLVDILVGIKDKLEFVKYSQLYFQPELESTGDVPDELASFEVFTSKEDVKKWMNANGYILTPYRILSYSGDEIEEPTFIDADGKVILVTQTQ